MLLIDFNDKILFPDVHTIIFSLGIISAVIINTYISINLKLSIPLVELYIIFKLNRQHYNTIFIK